MITFVFVILAILVILSLLRGFRPGEIFRMTLPGIRGALIVVEVLVLIGCLTGLWRSNGTVAYFITTGIRILPPSLFVLSAFLLTAVMSLAIGTSFGVVATAGVILMSIARAGEIALLPVAGAIMSGIYVGDRNSPASSSAALVAAVTGTETDRNVKAMFRSAAVPLLLCVVIYGGLSLLFPMKGMDAEAVTMVEANYHLHWICILPAVLMILLPLCRVKVKAAMAVDILVSFLLAVFLQGAGVFETLKTMVMGYTASTEPLGRLLNGGGIRSMFNVCIILLVSGSFSEILRQTGLLDRIYEKSKTMERGIGRYGTMAVLSAVTCMLFCNQTIGIMMVNQLGAGLYDAETEKEEKMLDIEDSVVVIAGLVPWCIASSVPLATLGVGPAALLFGVFLWGLPVWRLATSHKC